MTKAILTTVLFVVLVFGVASESDAAWGGKYITVYNASSSPVQVYYHINYYSANVWYNSNLNYDGVLYPGQSATYFVQSGLYGWFKIQDYYNCTGYCRRSCCNIKTRWIDARWSNCDQRITIY